MTCLMLNSYFQLGSTLLTFLLFASGASAQTSEVKISVSQASLPRAHVEGRREGGASAWAFRNFYGSAAGLAERVENFALFDESRAVVNVKKLAPGEFSAER